MPFEYKQESVHFMSDYDQLLSNMRDDGWTWHVVSWGEYRTFIFEREIETD